MYAEHGQFRVNTRPQPNQVAGGEDDQAYFSIWQSFMPEHTDMANSMGNRNGNGNPNYQDGLAKLPSGKDLVTPRSNLLSALSLDSTSGRTPFERSLFEQGYRF